MGIVNKTVMVCTCDLCGVECKPDETLAVIQVDGGDGRDVGPGHLTVKLTVDLPYRVSNGLVCHECKLKWLRKYVDSEISTKPATEGGDGR